MRPISFLCGVLSLLLIPAFGMAGPTAPENSRTGKKDPAKAAQTSGARKSRMAHRMATRIGPLKEGEAFSVVYKVKGNEITRYFTLQKGAKNGLRIEETEGAGGKAVTTAKENPLTPWALARVGFHPSTAKRQSPRPGWMAVGPDGKDYLFSEYRLRRSASEKAGTVKGPGGVELVNVAQWTKGAKGYQAVKIEPLKMSHRSRRAAKMNHAGKKASAAPAKSRAKW